VKFREILDQVQDDAAYVFREREEVFAKQKPPPSPHFPTLTHHPRLDLGSAYKPNTDCFRLLDPGCDY